LCFTLILGSLLGYTVNGITLAAVIIVLGIVVDDAIIVAENISRRMQDGESVTEAAVNGTKEMFFPIIASILTTCVAFLPLLFFSGRFGQFVKHIPLVIFLMLGASLLESLFLLPSHMTLAGKPKNINGKPWFKRLEKGYEVLLSKLLVKRHFVFLFFILLMVGATFLASSSFKFVMFPKEETRELVLSGEISTAKNKEETALKIQPLEDFLRGYIGKEGIGIRSSIAQGRRGGVATETQFRLTMEILPSEKRQKSADVLIAEIKAFMTPYPDFKKVKFRKSRWGQSSGSALEIEIKENKDSVREDLVNALIKELEAHPNISNPEADVIPSTKEYIVNFNQEELKRLSINPNTIATTLRTILEGRQLYTFFRTP